MESNDKTPNIQILLELMTVYSIVKVKKTFSLKQWLH